MKSSFLGCLGMVLAAVVVLWLLGMLIALMIGNHAG